MLNWLSLWQSMTWICEALTEAWPSCILPGKSFGKHNTAALVFFLCWRLLLLPVLPLRHCSSVRNNNHSGSALCHVCHHWAPSAAYALQPACCSLQCPCPLPPGTSLFVAILFQLWPGGGRKCGHGEVSSHHLDFKVWSQIPEAGGCNSLPSWLMGAEVVWCLLVL